MKKYWIKMSGGDLECLYKACQAAITDGSLFTDTGVGERGENGWQSENDNAMKTVSQVRRPENRQENPGTPLGIFLLFFARKI